MGILKKMIITFTSTYTSNILVLTSQGFYLYTSLTTIITYMWIQNNSPLHWSQSALLIMACISCIEDTEVQTETANG